MPEYLITKKNHQFTYYILLIKCLSGKYYYTWTGLTHNALRFKRDEVDTWIEDLSGQFPSDVFDYKPI